MSKRVFVSGYGVISALGFDAAENLLALSREKSGIAPAKHLKSRHNSFFLGEVKASNSKLSELSGITDASYSRTLLLGLIAAREALIMAGLSTEDCKKSGFINGTTVAGMDISETAYSDLLKGRNINYRQSFSGHDCGHSTELISRILKLDRYSATISTACSSSANSIMQAGRLIKNGHLDSVVAGGTDALSLFTLNGFNSLNILDKNWCKPFDRERKGLNLGEGAAYLVLESEESVKKRKGKTIAELIGFGNSNDAFHQTASSPDGNGAFLAMEKALELAKGISIDYVNAHGTGTENNDLSESIALKRIFADEIPPYSSTKSYTGHTLGAAGAIEAVYSIMSMEEEMIFPNLNCGKSMGIIGDPVKKLRIAKTGSVLSNSFGFGGNCSSLIFSRS